jgi:hypothetical protein
LNIADKCLVCNATNINKEYGSIAPFVSYRTGIDPHTAQSLTCNECGLRFSSVRFDDNEAQALYSDYRGNSYNEQRERYEPGYTKQYGHLNDTRNYIPDVEHFILNIAKDVPKKILDIGGNDGKNTPFYDKSNVDVYEVGDELPQGKYDLIVLSHVLEHVSWPKETITMARSFLNKSGFIYAEMPYEDIRSVIWHEHVTQFHHENSIQHLFDQRIFSIERKSTNLGEIWMVLAK